MKCDKLKSLWVYCRDINENVDDEFLKFAPKNGYEELVEKSEVDEAIAELKEFAEDACLERDDNQTAIDELEAENAELKQKLEDVQASMYCDVVDANMDNRRLRRALWIARAKRAEARKDYWYARSCHEGDKYLWSIDGSAVKYIGCIKRTNYDWLLTWSEVESKWRTKAEGYK
jgi:FtsZ-binding cell division protein ZapB